MKYYFSNKKVCSYLNEDATQKDFDINDAPKVALFGINDQIVKDLDIYKKINKKVCNLGGITIGKKLGEGVYGKVFDVCLKKRCDYAFKIIRLPYKDNFQEFWNEVFLQIEMSFAGFSPAIISAWTCKESDVMGYIIMEKVVKLKRQPKHEELKMLYEALDKKKICHNDMHKGNIFVTKDGIKLIDFGLAVKYKSNNKVYPRFIDTFALSMTPGIVWDEKWDRLMYVLNTSKKQNTTLQPFVKKYKNVLQRRQHLDYAMYISAM